MGILGLWVKKHLCGNALHHLTAVHNSDIVCHLVDNAQIVGDEQNAGAVFPLQIIHQSQDLRLNGNIQCGGRFICNQQLGTACQRHGNHNTLTHTTGKLVRILFGNNLGIRNLYLTQQVNRFFRRFLLGKSLMDDKRLRKLLFNRENGV